MIAHLSEEVQWLVSLADSALSTSTTQLDPVLAAQFIRDGEWASQVQAIRDRIQQELVRHGDFKKARASVNEAKTRLPGILWSGFFKNRIKPAAEKLISHSGLLCADLDNLGGEIGEIRNKLAASPYLFALFSSPTLTGLKAVFRVPGSLETHAQSFLSVEAHVFDMTGAVMDKACRDVARLCFVSFDPDAFINKNCLEIPLAVAAEKVDKPKSSPAVPNTGRAGIASAILGQIEWENEHEGFCKCPGQHLHTATNGEQDCRVNIDGVPSIHCFHNSCSAILARVNHELRSRIAKAEFVPTPMVTIQNGRVVPVSSIAEAVQIETATVPGEAFKKEVEKPVELEPIKELIRTSVDRYEELYKNRGKLGVRTGITRLDRESGGLKPGQMTVLAAETGGGKSSVALHIINTALQDGKGVLLFTLEMDGEEILDMLVSSNCSVNRNCFNTGEFADADFVRMTNGFDKLKKLPLWIEDSPSMSVSYIDQRTKVVQKQVGPLLSLVVVDYIQIVAPEDVREPREQQVATIARGLRRLAKEIKLPFLVLSQLNDEGKLRESRAIAHEAHNVGLITSKGELFEIKIVKGRKIAKGKYDLIFEALFCRFNNPGVIDDADVPYQTRPYADV